jgi:hypothetical protein
MSQTTATHDLDRNDPAPRSPSEPLEQSAARVRHWANVSEEQMRETVAFWKSGHRSGRKQ